MTQLMGIPPQRPRKRWTKHEYNDAVDRGLFEGQRVYLYRGELIEMPAMGTLHARGLSKLNGWLVRTFDPDFVVRPQVPIETPGDSMPEPDFAIVTHEQEANLPHPSSAVLVIEVSDSSVELDQEMAFDYAAALVPDYWFVNMHDLEIDVFRDPVPDAAAPLGFRYRSHRIYRGAESVSPLARPQHSIVVASVVTVT